MYLILILAAAICDTIILFSVGIHVIGSRSSNGTICIGRSPTTASTPSHGCPSAVAIRDLECSACPSGEVLCG
ncbi:hypothetical protein C8R44DRAFT_765509 [Mycena epipterygia]|nr:hypothetical protein C8R44DRAFT_765509 [Mycena epipterygia]